MIKLTLPIYWQQSKKKKILVSMNWFRNAAYFAQNKIKQDYHSLIRERLNTTQNFKFTGLYQVSYKLYYKNSNCDMTNITSLIDKFLNDALQEMGIVTNDNVKFYRYQVAEVVEQDKKNPRVEIEIKEL